MSDYGVVAISAAGLLLLVVAYLAVIGFVAMFTGARWERCPSCRHHALTTTGQVHEDGCPHLAASRYLHRLAAVPRHLHIGTR